MTTEQLQNILHATPFRPFTLCLAGGTRVEIPHPDFIAHRPGARAAVVESMDEKTHFIDLLLVTEIEISQAVRAVSQREDS